MPKLTPKHLLAAWLLCAALPVNAKTEISIDQARALAIQSLQNGQVRQAAQLSFGVLKAAPQDGVMHFVLGQAYSQLNQPDAARKSARLAFRYANSSIQKFEAAQLAAKMSYQGERPTLAQLWLRRAANHAPTEQAEAIVASDYKRLRQINPWSFRLSGGITPTDNLNNGTDNAYLVVDGVADGGIIVGSLPLSGLEGHLDTRVSYRLRANKTSLTQWNARLYIKEVKLSDEAKAITPSASASDFAYVYFDTGFRHGFAIGENGTTGAISGNIGQTWSGRNAYARFARVTGDLGYKLSDATSLSLNASAEQQDRIDNSTRDSTIFGFGAAITHRLDNGDLAGLSFSLRDTNSDGTNGSNEFAALRASYALGRPLGPVSVRGGLTYSYRNYGSYFVGFNSVRRQDQSLSADITMVFNDISYAGFVPSVTVRTKSTGSNVNRFETKGISISMGIQSKF